LHFKVAKKRGKRNNIEEKLPFRNFFIKFHFSRDFSLFRPTAAGRAAAPNKIS
jgi:hypothetical protein